MELVWDNTDPEPIPNAHFHFCMCCNEYYDCDDAECNIPSEFICCTCNTHENIRYAHNANPEIGEGATMPDPAVHGPDNFTVGDVIYSSDVKMVRISCPQCDDPDCAALCVGQKCVSWCPNGHVVISNPHDHMTVYKFL